MTTALEGVRGQCHAPATLYPRERPGTHCTGGWEGPRAGLDRSENLASIGNRSPNGPARSQSLYRLRYPAPDPLPAFMQKQYMSHVPSYLIISTCREFYRLNSILVSVSVAARSRAWVCDCLPVEIVGSNPARAMDVCLL
jgi:hypothetical protein